MTDIRVARGLHLPLDAVTQRIAVMGMQGSGKSNTAARLVEQMLENRAQVVVLDNDGSWYGLRLPAKGGTEHYEIPVFGGLHGDIPLQYQAGAMVADLIVDKGISVVLDVSMFRKGQRRQFATDFAEQLFHRKKSAKSPMMFVIEEAQDFIPQRTMKGEERMLGAFEDISKLGRKYGIGVIIISQRPQSVNKDALNQAELLFVHQTMGTQERKALAEWIVDKGLDKSLLEELPSLNIGEAYVWSPRWLKTIRKAQIEHRATFDAAATPKFGAKAKAPPKLNPMDLKEISEAMKGMIERAESADPAKLKTKLLMMTAERDAALSQMSDMQKRRPEVRVEKVEVPMLSKQNLEDLDELRVGLGALENVLVNVLNFAKSPKFNALQVDAASHGRVASFVPSSKKISAPRLPIQIGRRPVRERVQGYDEGADVGKLTKAQRSVLTVLAQFPEGRNRDQIAALSGYAKNGGGFLNAFAPLDTAGLIEGHGHGRHFVMTITPQGLAALGDYEVLPAPGEELLSYWRGRLGKAPRAVFDVLCSNPSSNIPKDNLAEMAGYTPRTGGVMNAMGHLKTIGVAVEQERGCLMLNPDLLG